MKLQDRRRVASAEEKRKRRMLTYPETMWSILQTIQRGESFKIETTTWHAAVALRHRFYKFRVDAIEEGIVGALRLNDVSVSGVDSLGARLSSNNEGIGPYLVSFDYFGEKSDIGVRVEAPRELEKGMPYIAEIDRPDFSKLTKPVDTAERLMENWLKSEEVQQHPARCQHEWDVTETRCVHCGVPK